MLKIIICEDEKKCQNELLQNIKQYLLDKMDVKIECYDDGLALIEQLNKNGELEADLIFLDIRMPGADGITIAKMLRKNYVEADIIFMSNHKEYVFQGYEVHAYEYLVKPVTYEMLELVLKRYLEERVEDKNRYLIVNKRPRKMRIPLKHVRYFISDKRKIKAVMGESYGELDFYMKLEELEDRLRALGFIRCHQSYLVNVHKILSWDGATIQLVGNEAIPVSRKYKSVLNKLYE